ncbi:deoxynucleoside kinase [[Mycoplasma] gypis]|uniref:Deoxynucleoside kinase n=1 Tax=[Mycoplasma] gypis TaxID=92404 RepID=A0ABZ2RR92_9BACT|nr:deoxynucleoside kinase [[Mycoplasma] gypis]MBN0919468.1 deoxynucleoside kinase [[Mycoplasma] gypis]
MIIGISGMISSGKSSLSEKLHKEYKTSKMLIEFDEDDEVFNTFLKWLYEKKPDLTIGFQSYIVESHSTKFNKVIDDYQAQGLNPKKDHIFLDRFSLEHYIFAKINLMQKGKRYLEAYDALFEHLITEHELPDLAIFLDINFETFKKRIFQRGRKSEIDNWEKNIDYFKILHESYLATFEELAKKYNLKYEVIDTNNLTEQEVLAKAKEIIEKYSSLI